MVYEAGVMGGNWNYPRRGARGVRTSHLDYYWKSVQSIRMALNRRSLKLRSSSSRIAEEWISTTLNYFILKRCSGSQNPGQWFSTALNIEGLSMSDAQRKYPLFLSDGLSGLDVVPDLPIP
jgi:hypothetical protein